MTKEACAHCLPDCTTTIYDSSMTYAKLRKCDRTNLGTNLLCDLENGPFNPAPWMDIAQNEYMKANETIPWYLDITQQNEAANFRRLYDRRSKVGYEGITSNLLFLSDVEKYPTYDAFENDIGIINVYFSTDRTMKYVKKNRMSSYDFLSQIGGSIGLAMGISMISFVEIIYWFTIRLFKNIIRS